MYGQGTSFDSRGGFSVQSRTVRRRVFLGYIKQQTMKRLEKGRIIVETNETRSGDRGNQKDPARCMYSVLESETTRRSYPSVFLL